MNMPDSLASLIERGGIHHAPGGNSVQQVIETVVKMIPVPETIRPQDLFRAIMEREALMSTGIGGGIAIPHPRNPITARPEEQFVSLVFLDRAVDWRALDGKPVDTLLLLVCASAKLHLQTLSAVSFFCGRDEFVKMLREKVTHETLIRYIRETEKLWK